MDEVTWQTTDDDTVRVFRAVDGQWRWRVRAANGEIVGQGESHPHFRDAEAAALRHHPRLEQ